MRKWHTSCRPLKVEVIMMADIKFVQIEPETWPNSNTLRILYPAYFHRCAIKTNGENEAHCRLPTAEGTELQLDIRFREVRRP